MNLFTPFISSSLKRRTSPSAPTSPQGPVGPGSGPSTGPGRAPRRSSPPAAPPIPPPSTPISPPSPPIDDFASNPSTTGVLSVDANVLGSIEVASDSDWFKVVLQPDRSYRFSVDGVTLVNPVLAVRDVTGAIIQENDDRIPGSNLNPQIAFTPSVGGTYFLDVRSFGAGVGTYRLTAEELKQEALPPAPAPSPGGGFQIDIDYTGDPAYFGFFAAAAQRWSEVITADIPDFGGVDDLLISVVIEEIDGVGKVLGRAGPDALRPSSLGRLPYIGSTTLDVADVANLASRGTLDDVVLHEFGHILGIGTIWDVKRLRSGSNYIGPNAAREYNNLGASGPSVPLEVNGGPGTALSHWSESVFGDELMTGFLSGLKNPLSKVTVGSLQDLGYSVNYASADSFALPSSLVVAGSTTPTSAAERLSLSVSTADLVAADPVISGPTSCFCGTCSALAQSNFDLGQFSRSISGSTGNSPSPFPLATVSNNALKSEPSLSGSITTSSIILPSYLVTDLFPLNPSQDLVSSLLPTYMVVDQTAT